MIINLGVWKALHSDFEENPYNGDSGGKVKIDFKMAPLKNLGIYISRSFSKVGPQKKLKMPGGELFCRVVRNGHLALIACLSDRLEQILAALHVLWIFEKKDTRCVLPILSWKYK